MVLKKMVWLVSTATVGLAGIGAWLAFPDTMTQLFARVSGHWALIEATAPIVLLTTGGAGALLAVAVMKLGPRGSALLRRRRRWAEVARRIKEDFELEYSRVVAPASASHSLYDQFRHGMGGGGQDAPGFVQHFFRQGYQDYLDEWQKHMAFLAFRERAKGLPDTISREDLIEIVRLYVASMNEAKVLKERYDSMLHAKLNALNHCGATEELRARIETNDIERRRLIEDNLSKFHDKLARLNDYLRANIDGIEPTLSGALP